MDANDALELERVTAAARDALTDEMVSRLSATAADGIDLRGSARRCRRWRSWSRTAISSAWSRSRAPTARRRMR